AVHARRRGRGELGLGVAHPPPLGGGRGPERRAPRRPADVRGRVVGPACRRQAADRRRPRLAAAMIELERFVRGEPIAVEVGEIERALGALWQEASRVGDTVAVSRAALWNVIIPARGRAALATTKQLVDEIAPALPTRTLTLCLDDADAQGSGALEATIESNVVSQPGGARMVYSEEITIAGPSAAEGHFGALVRA